MKKTIALIAFCISPILALANNIAVNGDKSFNLLENKGKTLYLTFEDSPKMTELFKDQLSQSGMMLTSNPKDADLNIQIIGFYKFFKPRTKEIRINVGKILEESGEKLLSDKKEESYRTLTFNLNTLQPNISFGVALGAGILETVVGLTGVRSSFNKLIAGDERGFCIGGKETCKEWNLYTQEMRIGAFINPKDGDQIIVRSWANTKDEKLLPAELLNLALNDLSIRLTGAKSESVENSDTNASTGHIQ